jgi:hypothetical protein
MTHDDEPDSDDELERIIKDPNAPVHSTQSASVPPSGEWFVERSKFIPIRLTLGERKYLRLLEAALNVR